MTRVALILAHNPSSEIQRHHPPLALGYLASWLNREVADVEVGFFTDAESAAAFQPNLVGISSVTQNMPIAAYLADQLKAQTSAPIVLGGIHVSLLPETLPAGFDMGAIGEGERTIADLVRWRRGEIDDLRAIPGLAFRENGGVVQTTPRQPLLDLDEVPPPDVELLGDTWAISYRDRMLMYSSRGCPYKCNFCSGARFWRNYRCFSPEYLIREIRSRVESFGTRYFDFWDDLFIGDEKRLRRFAELFLGSDLTEKVVLGFSVRSNLVTPDRVRIFRELGIENVNFGAESGCDRILRVANKTGVTVETNQRAIDILNENGIAVNCSFIFGFPNETYGEMKKTLKFIKRNRDKLADIGCFPLLPFPGTPYWDLAVERGVCSLGMDWSAFEMAYGELDFAKLPYLNEKVSRSKLESVLDRAYELREEIVQGHGTRVQQAAIHGMMNH